MFQKRNSIYKIEYKQGLALKWHHEWRTHLNTGSDNSGKCHVQDQAWPRVFDLKGIKEGHESWPPIGKTYLFSYHRIGLLLRQIIMFIVWVTHCVHYIENIPVQTNPFTVLHSIWSDVAHFNRLAWHHKQGLSLDDLKRDVMPALGRDPRLILAIFPKGGSGVSKLKLVFRAKLS